jgi:hypothetical protein
MPGSSWPILANPQVWSESTAGERKTLANAIARAVGNGFRAAGNVGDAGLVCLVQDRFPEVRFAVVPGGNFEMGLTQADLDELSEYVDWTKRVRLITEGMRDRASPTRRVVVAPFLVAERPLLRAELELLDPDVRSPDLERMNAIRIAARMGMRLPSEAELEWLARDGGRFSFVVDGGRAWSANDAWPPCGSFGIKALDEGEWAADDWHPSYEGAPTTSEPWMNGEACGVFRGELAYGTDQDPSELCLGLAAHRNRGARHADRDSDHAFYPIRPAFGLP